MDSDAYGYDVKCGRPHEHVVDTTLVGYNAMQLSELRRVLMRHSLSIEKLIATLEEL